MFDHRNHSLWFREQGEVAGVRDHREFRPGDEPEALDGVLKPDKIVISESDENG